MSEIGGLLEYSKDFFNKKKASYPNRIYFKSGREVLRYLISNFGTKVLYIPSYFCDDVVVYLNKISGLKIKRYQVDERFRINTKILSVIRGIKKQKMAFLIVDYFGHRDEKCKFIVKYLKKIGVDVIIDRTHSALNQYEDLSVFEFASIRKLFVNLPGAYLNTNKYEGCYRQLNLRSSLMLLKLKSDYLVNGKSGLKATYLQKYRVQEKSYSKFTKSLCAVRSFKTSEVLKKANTHKMNYTRKTNYKILKDGLKQNGFFMLHPIKYKVNEAPAFALLRCATHEIREELKMFLTKNNIFCPVHWENGTRLSRLLLSLPIDHRYTDKDMQFVVSMLNKYSYDHAYSM